MEMRAVNEQDDIYEDTTAAPQISGRSDIKRENGQTKCIIVTKLFCVVTFAIVAILAIMSYIEIQRLQVENSQLRDRMTGLGQKLNNAIRQITGEVAIAKSFQGQDCKDVFNNGYTASGIYTINVGGKATQVYCDMETDGGGWIVFQRRFDGSVDFYRNWTSYQQGFGSLNGEFWLGLDLLHQLTTGASFKLRVDLEDAENNTAYAEYRTFTVGPESSKYTLTVEGYNGIAGDSLGNYHNSQQFSSYDHNHDSWVGTSGINCAEKSQGAWWYNTRDDYCDESNLNGEYLTPGEINDYRGLIWHDWKSNWESMKKTEMKIKPV